MSQRYCICGCTKFRFKLDVDSHPFVNICRNCNHTLSEHLHLSSVEQ